MRTVWLDGCRLPLLALCVGLLCPTDAHGQQGLAPAQREAAAVAHAERLSLAGRDTEGLAVLESLLLEQPTSVSGLVLFLQLAERRGEAARVLPWAERAVAAAGQGGASVRQVWIRALSAAGHSDSAEAVAREWVRSAPEEQAAYSELAALVARSAGEEPAIQVLERGREAIGTDRLYVQELANLYARVGQYEAAAIEWRTMLAWGDAGVDGVYRAVTDTSASGDQAVQALRAELRTGEPSALELRGGIRLALMLEEDQWSRDLVQLAVSGLPAPAATRLLENYVEQARDARNALGAAWAALELADRAAEDTDAQYWTAIAADLAHEAGDEAGARKSFEDLRQRADAGTDAHRLAVLRLHELVVNTDASHAETLLREYRLGYPDDQEASSHMALRTAAAWIGEGELTRGRLLLESEAPVDAAHAARRAALLGRLEVLEGHATAARNHLELAATVPGADPSGRVAAIRWLAMLDSIDSTTVARFGRGVVSVAKGEPEVLVAAVGAWALGRPDGGDVLLALSAEELEAAGFHDQATAVRSELVRRWPVSAETPGALLAMARDAARTDPHQAASWLEQLIVDHSDSALAPVARRELLTLQGSVPGS